MPSSLTAAIYDSNFNQALRFLSIDCKTIGLRSAIHSYHLGTAALNITNVVTSLFKADASNCSNQFLLKRLNLRGYNQQRLMTAR
jgi:uncharacterized membrane protein (DUF4010 family)